MTAPVRIDRRAFLRLGASGGGLLLGLQLPAPLARWVVPAASAGVGTAMATPAEFVPNAWLRIGSDGGILFLVARSEMGQGVMTALPMLLAEELGVGLDQIVVRFAPADPAYVNIRIGRQLTGGSTSVREAWYRLREAGALARTVLIEAAAARWGIIPATCRVERAQVLHPDGEQRLDFAALAVAAAALPLPAAVTLKPAAAWQLIGTPAPRLDSPDKVNGRARFGLDVRLTEKAVACVVRCPVFGGRLRGFDADAVEGLPGVIAVLPISSGVAVVAADTWIALQARRMLRIDWEPGPAAGLGSAALRARSAARLEQAGTIVEDQGDALTALAAASTRVEALYEVPYQAHACLEPMNCTADVRADGCDLYVPTQDQGGAQQATMEITGLPAAQVRVHTTFLGGGFGRRLEQDFVREAVALSKALGRPIQVVWTREDDLRHGVYRPAGLNRLRGGLDRAGRLVAWQHRVVAPSILARVAPAAVADGVDRTAVDGAVDLPYAIPNRQVQYRQVDSPLPVGFWRAVGTSQNTWITECFLDELAAAGGRDPLALRRTLLQGRPRHLAVLDLAAQKAGWGAPAADGRGRGIALVDAFGSIVVQVAEVSLQAGVVRVHRVVCAVDCGTVVNPDGVVAQLEGGILFGLTATLKGAITIADGQVEQGNFDTYPLLRASETPVVEVHIVPSTEPPGGVGEPGVSPIAAAVCNAVFAATGQPVHSLPIRLRA
ncbi:MAG: xanthine dehydrogenase family protein molybdopterin-binding subunit [Chromatiaceae bacterium]|nr:MAG: xanthine dehydrogenase family protein molybdopterin-binding subunit [Chromatiaceae bacterium]